MDTNFFGGEERGGEKNTGSTRKRRHIFRLAFALILLGILGAYAGYAWVQEEKHTSEIIVAAPFPETNVFINGEAEGSTGTLKRTVKTRRPAGEYSVLVSKDGFWPWMKNVVLGEKGENETLTLTPFLIPREVPKETIEKLSPGGGLTDALVPNPRYTEVIQLFQNASSSLSQNSQDSQKISQEIQELLAQIPLPRESIKNAEFFPNRRDVLIVAARNQVFAVEAGTTTEPRNFQPIYSGTDPDFIFAQEKNTLYIRDGEILSLIKTTDFTGR